MKLSNKIKDYAPPGFFLVVIIVLWEVTVQTLRPPRFIISAPTEIITNMVEIGAGFYEHASITTIEILLGFALGAATGIGMAIAIAHSRIVLRVILPVAIAFQVVPKSALAPLFIIWFGFGIFSKVFIAALISFFPLVVDTTHGLTSVDPDLLDLVRTYNASKWRIFYKIRLQHALPYIFSGLKTASALAVIGAVVAEFIGSAAGLGRLILVAQNNFNTPLLFSSLIIITGIGILLFWVIQLSERAAAPWYFKMRERV